MDRFEESEPLSGHNEYVDKYIYLEVDTGFTDLIRVQMLGKLLLFLIFFNYVVIRIEPAISSG